MGLYNIRCNQCEKEYVWFSGNVGAAQICPNCEREKNKPQEIKIMPDQKLVDALNAVIDVQKELIENLKKEIVRLQNVPVTITTYPMSPAGVPLPYYPPLTYPGSPYTPYINPLPNPIYTTSDGTVTGDGSDGTISGVGLPPGSLQFPSVQLGGGTMGDPTTTTFIQTNTRNG